MKEKSPVGFTIHTTHALKTSRNIYVPQTYHIWTNLDIRHYKIKELLDQNNVDIPTLSIRAGTLYIASLPYDTATETPPLLFGTTGGEVGHPSTTEQILDLIQLDVVQIMPHCFESIWSVSLRREKQQSISPQKSAKTQPLRL